MFFSKAWYYFRIIYKLVVNTIIPYRHSRIRYYSQYSLKYYNQYYGNEKIRAVGCGPFSCSIVASSLMGEKIDPITVCEWSIQNGCYEYRHGTMHSLIPRYFQNIGLECEDLGDSVNMLTKKLKDGNAMAIILCREGTFAKGRHFIAVGMEKERYKIYNSSNVLDCYRKYDEETIQNALAKENIYIGPIWYITKKI